MEGFVWTVPCYILAATPVVYTDAGGAVIGSNLQFIAPELGPPGGEQGIAIFTDAHLAEEYRDQTDSKLNLSLMQFATPSQLKAFLERAQDQYRRVVVDLNRKVPKGRVFLIHELISELGRCTDNPNDQDRQR